MASVGISVHRNRGISVVSFLTTQGISTGSFSPFSIGFRGTDATVLSTKQSDTKRMLCRTICPKNLVPVIYFIELRKKYRQIDPESVNSKIRLASKNSYKCPPVCSSGFGGIREFSLVLSFFACKHKHVTCTVLEDTCSVCSY